MDLISWSAFSHLAFPGYSNICWEVLEPTQEDCIGKLIITMTNPIKTLLIMTLPIKLINVALRIMDFVTMTKRMKTLLITTLPIKLINVALRMDFVTMTKRMKTLLITTLPITLINVALRITDFTCNRFNLSLNLLLTV
jgi:hypothetical protein